MIPDALRSHRPALAVRVMLLAEVLAFVAIVMGIIWLHPTRGRPLQWYNIVLWASAVLVSVGGNILHGDRPGDSGLRVDNLRASGREACVVTAVLVAGVGAAAVVGRGWHFESWPDFAARSGEIFAVAFAQQYVLQAFMLRRLAQAGLPRPWAVGAAAVLFAGIHAPNLVLVAATALAAVVWCCLFLRHANLFVLGLSHGLLSLWMYYAWPSAWHLRLAVGPRALVYLSRYWGW